MQDPKNKNSLNNSPSGAGGNNSPAFIPMQSGRAGGKKYSGVVVPVVTPLKAGLSLDEEAAIKILQHLSEYDTQAFILGTTGEAASLPVSVKEDYIKLAGKLKKPGTHLYAGISSNCLEESLEMANHCATNYVDVVVATVPSYYALTELQAKKYFEQLADKSPLPVVIYNIPATTHVSLSLSMLNELSHHPNIVGAKDSERSDERLAQSIALWKNRNDFSHFVGWAARSAQALIDGSDGIIPSTGNLTPAVYRDMLRVVKDGDHKKAHELQAVSDLLGNIYQGGKTLGESLWALKFLMKQKGLCEAIVMPPLLPMGEEEKNILKAAYRDVIEKAVY